MVQGVYINMSVKDLNKSKAFFTQLGFEFNPQFTNDDGAAMMLGANSYAMLLTEKHFKPFTPKPIANAKEVTETLTALQFESRAKVEEMVKKAVAAGGKIYSEPKDHGFMFQHGFEDLDGHIWEVFYFDTAALPTQG